MIFEDTSDPVVSDQFAETVIADLALVYFHMTQYDIVEWKPVMVNCSGEEIVATRRLVLSGGVRMFPSPHGETFGIIADVKETQSLIIPKELVVSYRNAVEFRDAHQREFVQLGNVITRLESSDPRKFDGMRFNDLVVLGSEPSPTPELMDHLVKELRTLRVRRPSILDLGVVPSPPEAESINERLKGKLSARMLVYEGDTLGRIYFRFLWVDDKWLFLVE